jgi:predicted dehydrogenase
MQEAIDMFRHGIIAAALVIILLSMACAKTGKGRFAGARGEVKLVVIDPGHFHAALVQKSMYAMISPQVHVYAPEGPDADDYLKRIEGFNSRKTDPTCWREIVYRGPGYLEAMVREKAGNVAVIAGNNKNKTEIIQAAVDAGMNVLADKPMCIDSQGFERLKRVFIIAGEKGLLIKDMMTERFEITSMLQRALANDPEVFGTFEKGTPDDPAVTKESVHHFSKLVAGVPIVRPAWFFDVKQQGEGLVDVTTHLADLIQWGCFPDQVIQYQTDIKMLKARRWPTLLTQGQFEKVTGLKKVPDYLQSCIRTDGMLGVYSNGEMIYKIKGIHAKVSVSWNFEAPPGGGDEHYSIMKGTKARIIIRQGKEQNYKTELVVEPSSRADAKVLAASLAKAVQRLDRTFPGLALEEKNDGWLVLIPESYRVGHEAHFSQVTESFLDGLVKGKLPEWEVPNMIAKYYTTTTALKLAEDGR